MSNLLISNSGIVFQNIIYLSFTDDRLNFLKIQTTYNCPNFEEIRTIYTNISWNNWRFIELKLT